MDIDNLILKKLTENNHLRPSELEDFLGVSTEKINKSLLHLLNKNQIDYLECNCQWSGCEPNFWKKKTQREKK